jgi:hypothetical protein
MILPGLTILNLYRLTGTVEDFNAAIKRLAARVSDQGHPGVLSYRFFVNGAEKTARAVIDYEDSAAWIGHHDIAMAWPEMAGLHAVASLSEVTFLGPLTPDIQSWIDNSKLTARIHHGNSLSLAFSGNTEAMMTRLA